MPEYRIDFQPIGSRVFTNGKESLLALAQRQAFQLPRYAAAWVSAALAKFAALTEN